MDSGHWDWDLDTGNGKKCQNGNGINIFEHWEVGFVKHMGWEMGLEPPPPPQDPQKSHKKKITH